MQLPFGNAQAMIILDSATTHTSIAANLTLPTTE